MSDTPTLDTADCCVDLEEARGISLAVQERDCRAWCATNKVEVAAVFMGRWRAFFEANPTDQRPETGGNNHE